jgi:DNA-binding NarL/FixJ family response regulator
MLMETLLLPTQGRGSRAGVGLRDRPSSSRILIASAEPLFLDGLETLVGREPDTRVVARCADDGSIRRDAEELQPDVALLDIDLSRLDGGHLVCDLRDAVPAMKLIVFTARADREALLQAVRLGVLGVLLKSVDPSQITQCLRAVRAGGCWPEKQLTAAIQRRTVRGETALRGLSPQGLTPREAEIATLAGRGLRNLEIGSTLNVSPATVKVRLYRVYQKLGLSGRLALIAYAGDHAPIRSRKVA